MTSVALAKPIPAPLARLARAVTMLAESRNLREVKKIHEVAKAAAHYARAEKLGEEAVQYALEVQFRAAERAGELLLVMEKAKGAREPGTRRGSVKEPRQAPTLSDLGISKKQAMDWQNLARLDKTKFEDALPRLVAGEPIAAVIPAKREPLPGWDRESSRRRGAFERLCSDLPALGEPLKVAREMKPFDDDGQLFQLALAAHKWLGRLTEEWGTL